MNQTQFWHNLQILYVIRMQVPKQLYNSSIQVLHVNSFIRHGRRTQLSDHYFFQTLTYQTQKNTIKRSLTTYGFYKYSIGNTYEIMKAIEFVISGFNRPRCYQTCNYIIYLVVLSALSTLCILWMLDDKS